MSTPVDSESSSYTQLLDAHRKLQSSYALLESNFILVSNKHAILVDISARLANEYNRLTPFLQVRLPDDEELHAAVRRLQLNINK